MGSTRQVQEHGAGWPNSACFRIETICSTEYRFLLMAKRPHTEAVNKATLVRCARAPFFEFIALNPFAMRVLMNLLLHDLNHAEDHQLLLSRKSATERVATFLIALAHDETIRLKLLGTVVRSTEVHLWMSRTDTADYLGLTTETVSRTLTDLRNSLIIAQANLQRLLIPNIAALRSLCGEAGSG